MPRYIYSCEKCGRNTEIRRSMDKIVGYKQKCSHCKSKKTYRNFRAECVSSLPAPQTLGMTAIKNSETKSSDELNYIHEKNTEYLKKKDVKWDEFRN